MCLVAVSRLGRTRRFPGHDVVDLIGIQGFNFQKGFGHRFDFVAVTFDQFTRQRVLLIDDATDLGVHLLHGGLGNILVRGDRAPQKYFALVFAIDHGTHRVRHAPLGHHAARHLGSTFEIVGSAGGHLMHENLFGDTSAKQHSDGIQNAVLIHAVSIFRR